MMAPAASSKEPLPPLQAVASVDLNRYVGKWYEIAHLPNWFQRGCASGTTAEYDLRPDGSIGVVNRCRQSNGRVKSARGRARLADKNGPNSKLSVSFFWPFRGSYWIIDLDPEYQWAVVGEPGRDYLWILSRQPKMEESLYAAITGRARQQGYDVTRLMRTSQ